MTMHARAAMVSLLIAVPWGWYADLSNGEYGWFVGRLIFVPCVAYGLSMVLSRTRPRADRQA